MKNNLKISSQLAVIANWNPGISLSAADMKKASAGKLVLVGLGSILPTGSGVLSGGATSATSRGCIEYMRYQKGSDELSYLIVDGNAYSDGNLNEFREILEKAAFHMKVINFCWNSSTKTMTMLNIYPKHCCKCEKVKNG